MANWLRFVALSRFEAHLTWRISFKRHRFPADVTRHAVWLYVRFTLSLLDVQEMMAQRGIEVSYETIRCWTLKF